MLPKFNFFLKSFVVIATISFASTVLAQDAKTTKEAANIKYPSKEDLLKIKDTDFIIGKSNAPITIIEYSSLSCSHCANFYTKTLGRIEKEYIDTGKVRFVFRDFPLNEPALKAAMLVSCAKPENKTKFTNVLFGTQTNWAANKNYLEILENIAKLGGMKGEDFNKCMKNTIVERNMVESRFFAAKVLDINATPTFYINNEKHDGNIDFATFSKIIDEKLPKEGKK